MTARHRVILAAVLLLTAFTYRNALHNGFVWDDTFTIVNNRALDSLGSAGSWFTDPDTWSSRNEASYRPVITAGFGGDVALSGRNPAWFHAVNIGIHLAVIVLAYLLAVRLWNHAGSALVAAGIVALHPINAEAVNYVSARSSLLTACFVLASVAAWSRAERGSGSVPWLAAGLGLGLGALALGTKETAVVLPLLIMAWDRATSGPDRPFTATIRASIPWWVLVAAYLALRTWLLAGKVTERPIGDGAWQPVLLAIKIFLVSLWSWFVPTGSAVDHGWAWRIGAGALPQDPGDRSGPRGRKVSP
ncbi:MAG TPA: hypothetical protein VFN94_07600 [Nitrospiria bacterium]|nr:hypothetical protein [Nitrospiria bacterium]